MKTLFELKWSIQKLLNLLVLLVLTVLSPGVSGLPRVSHIFSGTLDVPSKFSINESSIHIHEFKLNRSYVEDFEVRNIRVETEVEESKNDEIACPLVFTLRQHRSTRSWALPMKEKSKGGIGIQAFSDSFTVCLDENAEEQNVDPDAVYEFVIVVTTCRVSNATYNLTLATPLTGFLLPLDNSTTVEVAPTMLHFFRFNFPPDMDHVLVRVESSDSICVTVAVQSPYCELLNEKALSGKDKNFNAFWQDMSTRAIIPVAKEDFKEGFFIAFRVLSNDDRCTSYQGVSSDVWTPIQNDKVGDDPRRKNVTVWVTEVLSSNEYSSPLVLPVWCLMAVIFSTFLIYNVFNCIKNRLERSSPDSEDSEVLVVDDDLELDQELAHCSTSNPEAGTVAHTAPLNNHARRLVIVGNSHEDRKQSPPWLRMDVFQFDGQKNSFRRVHLLVLATGIFYVVPTIQLLYTYHEIILSTGQTDLCYRNYLCSHRMLGWDDFNHIYSNVGYLVLGLVFLGFVWHYRRTSLRQGDHGVFQQFGAFYGLGLALFFEGVLSGLYHVCPTQLNFQFDTLFMYVLAVLFMIKLYQFRHPNPVCPHNTFGLLALISSISVGGIVLGNKGYEGVFIFFHILTLVLLSIHMYYIGYVTDEDGKPVTRFFEMCKKSEIFVRLFSQPGKLLRPRHKARFLFLLPLLVLNIVIDVYQLMGRTLFPTYLINLFGGNAMLYFFYYLINKIARGEMFNVRSIQPLLYFLFSFILGIFGILYFTLTNTNSYLSPAESRASNGDCVLQKFYDAHDLWHFYSAGAIFYFLMMLLTLDDGISRVARSEIAVF